MKDQELNLAIGKQLRMVRSARGLTQAELGEEIGVTFQQIQKYENGTNRLSVAIMLRLCRFMDVDAGEFVSGISAAQGDRPPDEPSVIVNDLRRIPDETVRNNLFALIRSLAALQ
ncbi:helix-turn-helix domain-containing protein [Allorhizobium pseudoryzae]|jgi:transcriptional regulator with XRE-family HTH domain|uniref:helix-turn-helix domain-containing protein n=1 Tax=Allorhizobium pseudoryzae TaxID=379684 RepID=UPI003D054DED